MGTIIIITVLLSVALWGVGSLFLMGNTPSLSEQYMVAIMEVAQEFKAGDAPSKDAVLKLHETERRFYNKYGYTIPFELAYDYTQTINKREEFKEELIRNPEENQMSQYFHGALLNVLLYSDCNLISMRYINENEPSTRRTYGVIKEYIENIDDEVKKKRKMLEDDQFAQWLEDVQQLIRITQANEPRTKTIP